MKIKRVISIIIVAILIFSFFSLLKKGLTKENKFKNEEFINREINYNISSEPTPKETSVNEEVLFSFGNNDVVITQDSIAINALEFAGELLNPKGLLLDSTNYPELFEPKDDSHRIHVKEISGGDKSESKLLFISRQVFSRGGMGDGYYVVVDPEIGKVVDTGYNNTFGNVHFNNSCTSCALPVLLFRQYNQQQQKFIVINNQHKKEFVDLLKQYEQTGNKEICRINGKDNTINEAIKSAKDTERCVDLGMGGMYPDAQEDSFITVGGYKQIVNNIKEIINGKNIEMVDNSKYHGEGLCPLTL